MADSIRRAQNTSRVVIVAVFLVTVVCALEPRFVAFDVALPPVHLLVAVANAVWHAVLGLMNNLL
jgi:hypothetical protein